MTNSSRQRTSPGFRGELRLEGAGSTGVVIGRGGEWILRLPTSEGSFRSNA